MIVTLENPVLWVASKSLFRSNSSVFASANLISMLSYTASALYNSSVPVAVPSAGAVTVIRYLVSSEAAGLAASADRVIIPADHLASEDEWCDAQSHGTFTVEFVSVGTTTSSPLI